MFSTRLTAILQALFVTFIWSLSWVLIKFGLADIPALVFAGLRYSIAALCLLALLTTRPRAHQQILQLTRRQWMQLALLGLIFYAITQGAQFVALNYLPAVTLSLMLNFTVALVAISGIFLWETPNRRQWLGIALFIAGAIVYFGPTSMPSSIGLMIGAVGVAANAAASVLGRSVNRDSQLSPLVVTSFSMGIGSLLLLGTGLILQGLPELAPSSWLLIIWLAVVHTALTFTLWNQTLRHLQAFESSLINNTMLIQIALLAWIFLGEGITAIGGLGLLCAAIGIVIVQLGARKSEV